MAWNTVKVNIWDGEFVGQFNGDELNIPNFGEVPSELRIGSKNYKVKDSSLDERDNIWKMTLAMANVKKEKSDGNKSAKGSS